MLDRIRQTLAPSTIKAERDQLQERISKLEVDREDLRLEAGRMVYSQQTGFDSSREREIGQINIQMNALDVEISAMRTRRRQLDQMMKPETPPHAALVSVPMPREAAKAIDALNEAREERRAIQHELHNAGTDAEARKLVIRLGKVEERIVELRRTRADALVPYNAALSAALKPVIDEAARKLLAASTDMLAALTVLTEAAEIAPPVAPGLGNGLGPVIGINQGQIRDAATFAQNLIGWDEVAAP